MIIDIVVTTRNRLDYLEKTLTHIFERTRSDYDLHIIDDASEEENQPYLLELYRLGKIHTLTLRRERCGAMANLNLGAWSALSDPVVFTDDDVLCPDLSPDWLSQGITAMRRRKNQNLGLLALNHPGAHRRIIEDDGEVTKCRFIGGTFMFVRRKFLRQWSLPHFRDNYGITPTTKRCHKAHQLGWDIGFLSNVYCYHIGHQSEITGQPYGGAFIPPVSWETLEPPEKVKR